MPEGQWGEFNTMDKLIHRTMSFMPPDEDD
jgi:hypothetical protein